ncbi:hypothetical protein GJ496_008986 [Pomphorhynchus laevis]|nr:hypothetical protein GJ496_008986 [Pomphorhynchus laevis]
MNFFKSMDFEPDFQAIFEEKLTEDVIDTSLKEDEYSSNEKTNNVEDISNVSENVGKKEKVALNYLTFYLTKFKIFFTASKDVDQET